MSRATHLQCGKCGEMVENTPRAIREHLDRHKRPQKPQAEKTGPPPEVERSEDGKK